MRLLSKRPPFSMSLRGRLLSSILISVFFMIAIILVYYYNFQIVQKEQARMSFEQLSGEIETSLNDNIQRLNETAQKTAYSLVVQTYLLTDDPVECISNAWAAEEIAATYKNGNELALDIFLYSEKNRQVFCDSNFRSLELSFLKELELNRNDTLGEPFVSEIRYRSYGSANIPYVFFVAPAHSILSGTSPKTGNRILSIIPCDVEKLVNLSRSQLPDNSIVVIESETGEIAWSSETLSEEQASYLHRIPAGHSRVKIGREANLAYAVSIPALNCRLVCFVPEHDILDRTVYLRNISFLICLLGALLLLFCMVLIIRSITQPVAELSHSLSLLGSDAGSRIPIPKMPELQHLARNINRMLARIDEANQQEKELQYRLYQAAIAQNEAELRAYRTQINPHFLFNTLECIRSIAHHNQIKQIERMIRSMARMFRYSLQARPIVTLADELKHIENYFAVMDERFPGEYQLRIRANDKARAHPMLSMILQPLAENCISHGFAQSKKASCILLVECSVDTEDLLTIHVTDNGVGIAPEQLKRLQEMVQLPVADLRDESKTSGIGVSNIFRRLKLTFGDSCRMQISSAAGYYTKITMQIPNNLRTEHLHLLTGRPPAEHI